MEFKFLRPNSGHPKVQNFTNSSPPLKWTAKWLTARKPSSASDLCVRQGERFSLLNGQPYELKGTCNHQDMAGVGAALPDALQYFRIAKLKEFGDNAYRTSHNPPHAGTARSLRPSRHDCDGRKPPARQRRAEPSKWDDQIRRDRNHASVGIWSIANEEFAVQDTPQAANVARTMLDYVKRLDPTRPVTYAAPEGDVFSGCQFRHRGARLELSRR